MLAGRDPRDGSPLGTAAGGFRGVRLDVLGAQERQRALRRRGDELRAACSAAHDVAVPEAFGYLERSAAAVRRGPAVRWSSVAGFVAAGFRHRTSRAGDPQLHTHLLVANVVARQRRALVGARRAAAVRARAGGELHLPGRAAGGAHARAGRRVGAGPRRDRRGRRRARAVREAFSRRRVEIEAALEGRGTEGRARPRRRRWPRGGRRTSRSVPRTLFGSGGLGRPSWGSAGRSWARHGTAARPRGARFGPRARLRGSGRPAGSHALARDVLSPRRDPGALRSRSRRRREDDRGGGGRVPAVVARRGDRPERRRGGRGRAVPAERRALDPGQRRAVALLHA